MKINILIAFTLCLAATTSSLYAADKPNIILIYTDDQGYGDCSLLNPNSKFQTPHIDSIGKEGVVFTDGHCSDTVCSPSRYGLITGRYSWRTYLKKGVINSTGKPMIANDRSTLATLLKRNGYNTAMVGKWHMGMAFNKDGSKILDGPIQKGFDYFWGIPASMNYGYCAWYDMDTAKVPPILFTRKKPNKMAISDYRIMPPYESKAAQKDIRVAEDFLDMKVLQLFSEKSIAWVDKIHKDDKPFFLYLPLTSPHKPVVPQDRFRGKSKAGAYGDFMIETDFWIGRLIDTLKKHGIYDNTMIIFSSDNGPETTFKKRIDMYKHRSNETLREGKRSIYEGGHRVPFFVSWPKGIKGGRVCNAPVSQTDIFATIADIVGDKVRTNEAEDSISFAPFLKGNNLQQRSPMLHHSSGGGFAVREGQWKLVFGKSKKDKREPMALFDLSKDRSEKEDLLSKYPEIVADLTKRAAAIIGSGKTRQECTTKNDTPVALWWK